MAASASDFKIERDDSTIVEIFGFLQLFEKEENPVSNRLYSDVSEDVQSRIKEWVMLATVAKELTSLHDKAAVERWVNTRLIPAVLEHADSDKKFDFHKTTLPSHIFGAAYEENLTKDPYDHPALINCMKNSLVLGLNHLCQQWEAIKQLPGDAQDFTRHALLCELSGDKVHATALESFTSIDRVRTVFSLLERVLFRNNSQFGDIILPGEASTTEELQQLVNTGELTGSKILYNLVKAYFVNTFCAVKEHDRQWNEFKKLIDQSSDSVLDEKESAALIGRGCYSIYQGILSTHKKDIATLFKNKVTLEDIDGFINDQSNFDNFMRDVFFYEEGVVLYLERRNNTTTCTSVSDLPSVTSFQPDPIVPTMSAAFDVLIQATSASAGESKTEAKTPTTSSTWTLYFKRLAHSDNGDNAIKLLSSDTVLTAKKKYERVAQISTQFLRFTFAGRQLLDDARKLEDVGLKDKETIHVVVRGK